MFSSWRRAAAQQKPPAAAATVEEEEDDEQHASARADAAPPAAAEDDADAEPSFSAPTPPQQQQPPPPKPKQQQQQQQQQPKIGKHADLALLYSHPSVRASLSTRELQVLRSSAAGIAWRAEGVAGAPVPASEAETATIAALAATASISDTAAARAALRLWLAHRYGESAIYRASSASSSFSSPSSPPPPNTANGNGNANNNTNPTKPPEPLELSARALSSARRAIAALAMALERQEEGGDGDDDANNNSGAASTTLLGQPELDSAAGCAALVAWGEGMGLQLAAKAYFDEVGGGSGGPPPAPLRRAANSHASLLLRLLRQPSLASLPLPEDAARAVLTAHTVSSDNSATSKNPISRMHRAMAKAALESAPPGLVEKACATARLHAIVGHAAKHAAAVGVWLSESEGRWGFGGGEEKDEGEQQGVGGGNEKQQRLLLRPSTATTAGTGTAALLQLSQVLAAATLACCVDVEPPDQNDDDDNDLLGSLFGLPPKKKTPAAAAAAAAAESADPTVLAFSIAGAAKAAPRDPAVLTAANMLAQVFRLDYAREYDDGQVDPGEEEVAFTAPVRANDALLGGAVAAHSLFASLLLAARSSPAFASAQAKSLSAVGLALLRQIVLWEGFSDASASARRQVGSSGDDSARRAAAAAAEAAALQQHLALRQTTAMAARRAARLLEMFPTALAPPFARGDTVLALATAAKRELATLGLGGCLESAGLRIALAPKEAEMLLKVVLGDKAAGAAAASSSWASSRSQGGGRCGRSATAKAAASASSSSSAARAAADHKNNNIDTASATAAAQQQHNQQQEAWRALEAHLTALAAAAGGGGNNAQQQQQQRPELPDPILLTTQQQQQWQRLRGSPMGLACSLASAELALDLARLASVISSPNVASARRSLAGEARAKAEAARAVVLCRVLTAKPGVSDDALQVALAAAAMGAPLDPRVERVIVRAALGELRPALGVLKRLVEGEGGGDQDQEEVDPAFKARARPMLELLLLSAAGDDDAAPITLRRLAGAVAALGTAQELVAMARYSISSSSAPPARIACAYLNCASHSGEMTPVAKKLCCGRCLSVSYCSAASCQRPAYGGAKGVHKLWCSHLKRMRDEAMMATGGDGGGGGKWAKAVEEEAAPKAKQAPPPKAPAAAAGGGGGKASASKKGKKKK